MADHRPHPRRALERALIVLLSLGAALACASSSWSGAPKVVFPITAEEADKVMYNAMVEEFGVASIHRMSFPQPGYRYAETTIKRLTTKGRTEAGAVITGFAFQTSGHRSEAVARNVAQLAAKFAPAIPQAQ